MARKPRIVLPTMPHHVVLRGNNRRVLFSHRGDYKMFLFFLRLALERSACTLSAITIMTNHVHLLLTPPEEDSLARCIKSLAQRYAQLRNEQRDASGKLFEERFFSRPVLSEYQVGVVTSYIHANPVRSGQVKDPIDYRWSTHAHHAGARKRSWIHDDLWTPSDWFLDLAKDPWRRGKKYLQAYDDYFRNGVEPEYVDELKILEAISDTYELRLRRPDGSRAAEDVVPYDAPGHLGKISK
jgi:REP-associated tyrosine transposase